MLMGLYHHYLQSVLQYVIKDSLTLDEHVAIIFFLDTIAYYNNSTTY